ncbi:MAG: hypothetical protein IJX07_06700 [Bacillales bacterium]|nr:hypothetical protein [Bacillales bacterium]
MKKINPVNFKKIDEIYIGNSNFTQTDVHPHEILCIPYFLQKKTNAYIEALKIKTDQKYKKVILRQNENQSIDTKNWNQEDTNPFILIHMKKFLPLNKEITRRTV